MTSCARDIAELETNKQQLVAESLRIKNTYDEVSNETRNKQNLKISTERHIHEIERGLHELKSSGSDRLSLYGGQPLFQVRKFSRPLFQLLS